MYATRWSHRSLLALAALLAACAPPPPSGGLIPPGSSPSAAPTPQLSASPVPSATPAVTGLRLSGSVVDLERKPLEQVAVVARQGDREVAKATTGAGGTYALTLPPGDYEVTASREGLTRRTQTVALQADATRNFGPVEADLGNPYFLADDPEIERVEFKEEAPGQGLTLTAHLSEPLVEAARGVFIDQLRIFAGTDTRFLKQFSTSVARKTFAARWDDAGRVLTVTYPGPYLASGEKDAWYALGLEQDPLDEKDPVTRETLWDDMGWKDAAGRLLGRGQVRYAFKKKELFNLDASLLTDSTLGYYIQDRRWRLTHEGLFRFAAGRDTVKPGLTAARVERDAEVGTSRADVLTLTFTEPMSVAKDADNWYWTALDVKREVVILNGSAQASGPTFKPVADTLRPQELEIDRDDARIVELRYPVGAFDDLERLEVTLGRECFDPAGNGPDPAKGKIVVTLN